MAETSHSQDDSRTLPPALIADQLDRILKSQTFAQAPTLRRLLRYVLTHTTDREQRDLKEYTIGVDVFDRGPDFDPRIDTIVRVQARRLRAKLEDYYRREGAADPVIVDMPRGHYLAVWRLAPAPAAPMTASVVTPGPAASLAAASAALEDGASEPSIAVLPFANLSGDPENEYFTDGLTEEIISGLASVSGLRVVARTSVFQFKGRSDDIRRIGRSLGVQSALEGSVRKDGQRIRVTAQLIDVADGFHMWSHVFDGALPGIFSLQEETTRSIVEALRVRLRVEDEARLQRAQPSSIDAYELYLKGLFFFNKADHVGLETCVQYFQKAIALDGRFAAAYAAMSEAYLLWSTVGNRPAPQLFASARQAAERALELGDLAEAHGAMAGVLALNWEWDAAEREFRTAIELKPSLVYARLAYTAGCLCAQRRHDEALEQMRAARRLDPVSPLVRTILGQTLVLAGRPAEAVEQLQAALEIEPDFMFARYTLALAHLAAHSCSEAVATLQPLHHLVDQVPNCAGHLGYAHACLGNRAEAERILQSLLDRFPGEWAPWIDMAAISSGLGDATRALDWLERGYQARCFDSLFIREDPRFANLHSDPRFQQLLQKVGVVPRAGC